MKLFVEYCTVLSWVQLIRPSFQLLFSILKSAVIDYCRTGLHIPNALFIMIDWYTSERSKLVG